MTLIATSRGKRPARSAGWVGPRRDLYLVAAAPGGPSAAEIDSISAIADVECLVILGRLARTRPDPAGAALAALDSNGPPRAVKIGGVSRRSLPP